MSSAPPSDRRRLRRAAVAVDDAAVGDGRDADDVPERFGELAAVIIPKLAGNIQHRAVGLPQEPGSAIVLAGEGWHQGVVGIVAGKLKERYNVPAFVMSIEPDEVKGSARSVPGVDLGALIIAAKEKGLLTKGGGHTMAAGFSLPEDKIEAFRRFAGEYVRQKLGEEVLAPVIEVDSALDLLGANTDFAAALELLEPFGAGNAEPKIVLEHVRVVKPGIVGAGHVR